MLCFFDNEKLQIYLYTPLANEELIHYKCEISIKYPYYAERCNSDWAIFSRNCQLRGKEDWSFQICRDSFPWDYSFIIFIFIIKK